MVERRKRSWTARLREENEEDEGEENWKKSPNGVPQMTCRSEGKK